MNKENIIYTEPSLALNISKTDFLLKNANIGLHKHNALELIHLKSGKMRCHFKDSKITLDKNCILLVNRNIIHWLEPIENPVITYIQIDISQYKSISKIADSLITEFISSLNSKPYAIFEGDCELMNIFKNILKEANFKNKAYKNYIEAEIYHLIALMHREGLISKTYTNKLYPLENLLFFINNNYMHKLSLEELSEHIHTDKYRLCRLFKSATGGTLVEYINFLRLTKAEELLNQTNLSATEIAMETGFSSLQYFNKVFKNTMGCSPIKYRQLANKN